MKRLLAALILLMSVNGGVRAEVLSPQAFAQEMRRAFLAASPGATVSIEGENGLLLKARRADGSEVELSLANAYGIYKWEPSILQEIARSHVTKFAHAPSCCGKPDPTRIVPLIKDRAWLTELHERFAKSGTQQQAVYEDFNKELVIVYGHDTEKATRYLSSNEDLGIPRDELRKRAVDNFRRIMGKIEMRKHDDAFAMITSHPDYGASILLLDSIWSGDQIKFDGDTVIAVPAKDVVLATGSRNRAGLKAVRKAAADLKKGPYGLIDTLFVYRGGKFVKFGRD